MNRWKSRYILVDDVDSTVKDGDNTLCTYICVRREGQRGYHVLVLTFALGDTIGLLCVLSRMGLLKCGPVTGFGKCSGLRGLRRHRRQRYDLMSHCVANFKTSCKTWETSPTLYRC